MATEWIAGLPHLKALFTAAPSIGAIDLTSRSQSAVAAVSQVLTGVVISKAFLTFLPQAIHGMCMSAGVPEL